MRCFGANCNMSRNTLFLCYLFLLKYSSVLYFTLFPSLNSAILCFVTGKHRQHCHITICYLLSLTSSESDSEVNPYKNLIMRLAGLSTCPFLLRTKPSEDITLSAESFRLQCIVQYDYDWFECGRRRR